MIMVSKVQLIFIVSEINILVNVNECRRHEFRLTAYTAERLFKSAVNFVREYNFAYYKASGGCARILQGNMPLSAAKIRRSKRQTEKSFVVYYNTDCSVLRTPTIRPNIRNPWGFAPLLAHVGVRPKYLPPLQASLRGVNYF